MLRGERRGGVSGRLEGKGEGRCCKGRDAFMVRDRERRKKQMMDRGKKGAFTTEC